MAVRGSRSLSSSSSSSNVATACTRLVAVSPSHNLDYDCTDCGSFLFGHRARIRPRPTHGARTSSSSDHHQAAGNSNNISEPAQAHAQRLLLVPPILPQNEHEDFMNVITPAAAGDSEPVSLQDSDDELAAAAAAAEDPRVMEFVARHGAAPAAQVNDSSATLAEIFRCFICLGKVVDAQLCPCCSKLVCQPCIKRWLTDQKSECPHCRAPLLVSQLVNCSFISEISLEVEKIQGKLGDNPMEKYCPAHDSPLLYFCTTCSVAVCSDCAVLIEDHRNHTFEKLSVAYGRHKKKIRMEAAGLRRRRKELSALVASVDKNIEVVLKSKDESAAELQMALRRMQSRLEEQLKCKLLTLLAQKDSMTQEMELLDTILYELDQQLNSIPKSDLIAQEPNMSRMLQDIRTRTSSDISRTPIPPEFTSEVVPPYEHGELILENYKEKLTQSKPTVFVPNTDEVMLSKDVVYSELICGSGVAWRLKVYPNGSGASQGTHLSAFLEMVEGGNEAATYEYGIELLHRSRPNQRIVRKFSSDFEAGACWGYYQFFRIDLLEKEGYLTSDEDTITLRFHVRPLTYQQQCQDLRRSLSALQLERDESATQVAVIRRAFAATFFQRRRRRSTREQAAAAGSPTLAVRKPNIKPKAPEYTATRIYKPQPDEDHSSSTCKTPPSEQPQTLNPEPQTVTSPNPNSTENFTERDFTENSRDGDDGAEHTRPMQQRERRGEPEVFFHRDTHKMRSHRKMRSRKVLAHPEVILSCSTEAASGAATAARRSTSSSGDGDEAASSSSSSSTSSSALLREQDCECAAIGSGCPGPDNSSDKS